MREPICHLPLAVYNPEGCEVHVVDPLGGGALRLGHEVAHLGVNLIEYQLNFQQDHFKRVPMVELVILYSFVLISSCHVL